MDDSGTRRCNTCGQDKDLMDFDEYKGNRSGIATQCRECKAIVSKRHREVTHERIVARREDPVNKAKAKEYYEENKEALIAKSTAYREKNKDKVAARRRAHRAENKELYAAKQKAYRAGKKEKDAARATAVQGIQALRAERKIENDAIKSYFDSVTDMFVEELKKEGLTINDIFDIEVVETDTEDVFDVTYKVIED